MSAYSIAELSKTLNLTAPTLRYYEEIGLLPPVLRNTSGQRVYTEEHFDRLHAILCFKNAGMSIADIQKFFTYEANEQTHINEMLELLTPLPTNTLDRLHAEIKAYAHLLRKVEFYHAIKDSLDHQTPYPKWQDYDQRDYLEQAKQDLEQLFFLQQPNDNYPILK